MKIEFEGTVDELRELMSGDNVGTDIAVIQLDEDNYSRFFDENSLLWTGCVERDLMTLQHIRNYACDLLNCKGYLFLNNVLGMLRVTTNKEWAVNWLDLRKRNDCERYFLQYIDNTAGIRLYIY